MATTAIQKDNLHQRINYYYRIRDRRTPVKKTSKTTEDDDDDDDGWVDGCLDDNDDNRSIGLYSSTYDKINTVNETDEQLSVA